MKKNWSLHVLIIVLCMMVSTLNAGVFDGLRTLAKYVAASLWSKTVPLETPSDMLPLSEYHYTKKTYTNDDPVDDLGRQLAAGVRYFEFYPSQKTRSRYLGLSKETVVVAGKNSRELSSIIIELNALLHTSRYEHEIIFVDLKKTDQNWLNYIKSATFEKYICTNYDLNHDSLPLIGDLRHLDKRIVLFTDIDTTNYNIFPSNNINTIKNTSLSTQNANMLNKQSIGCDYFPKKALSFFSPHFNMYQYVGMDYGKKAPTATAETLKRDLAYGVRGFIFPLKKAPITVHFTAAPKTKYKSSIFIGDTSLLLTKALSIIDTFAKRYNEIVVVHLQNVSETDNFDLDAMIKMYCNTTCFKPTDRLEDLKTTPVYGQILKKYASNETAASTKIIWPRLTWNYRNNKLVQITHDKDQDTQYLWSFSQYYDPNNFTIRNPEITRVVYDLDTAASSSTAKQLFYSSVLKAEQTFSIAITTAMATALACLYIAQNLTSIESLRQAIENKSYEMWGKLSLKIAFAKTEQEKNDIGLILMGLGVGLAATIGTIADITYKTLQSLGLYMIHKTNKTFTAVHEGRIPYHHVHYTNANIIDIITQGTDGADFKKFEAASRYNVENFAAINTLNMGWSLRIAHTIRTLTRAKA